MKDSLVAATLALSLSGLFFADTANAIAVTGETDANVLAATVAANSVGFNVNSATLSGQGGGASVSSGTYTNASGTYSGLRGGIVLSSGNVLDYSDGPNSSTGASTGFGSAATPAQQAILEPIGGVDNYFDVTELDINFTTSTGSVFFLAVFGSEEWPEFVGQFVDGFGLLVDGVNIAFLNDVSMNPLPININHPDMTDVAGTELDGVLCPGSATGAACSPIMQFTVSGLNTAVAHTVTFIIADRGDDALDTTVYLSGLGGTSALVPEPGMLALYGIGLVGLLSAFRRKTSTALRSFFG